MMPTSTCYILLTRQSVKCRFKLQAVQTKLDNKFQLKFWWTSCFFSTSCAKIIPKVASHTKKTPQRTSFAMHLFKNLGVKLFAKLHKQASKQTLGAVGVFRRISQRNRRPFKHSDAISRSTEAEVIITNGPVQTIYKLKAGRMQWSVGCESNEHEWFINFRWSARQDNGRLCALVKLSCRKKRQKRN